MDIILKQSTIKLQFNTTSHYKVELTVITGQIKFINTRGHIANSSKVGTNPISEANSDEIGQESKRGVKRRSAS